MCLAQATSGDFKWGVMKAEVHCKEGKNVTSCIPRVQCNLKIIGAEDMLMWQSEENVAFGSETDMAMNPPVLESSNLNELQFSHL